MKLNAKNLKEIMNRLHNDEDTESYNELWKAITTLNNLGLVDDKLCDAMVEEDHKLFENA